MTEGVSKSRIRPGKEPRSVAEALYLEGWKEGYKEGWRIGYKEGREEGLQLALKRLIEHGTPEQEARELLGLS